MRTIEERSQRSRDLESVGLGPLTRADWPIAVAAAGVFASLVGVLAPWQSHDALGSYSGLETDDGKLFLACALVAAIALWRAVDRPGGPQLIIATVAGVLIAGGGLRVVQRIGDAQEQVDAFFGGGPGPTGPDLEPAWGLWLLILGGVIIAVGSALELYRRLVLGPPATEG